MKQKNSEMMSVETAIRIVNKRVIIEHTLPHLIIFINVILTVERCGMLMKNPLTTLLLEKYQHVSPQIVQTSKQSVMIHQVASLMKHQIECAHIINITLSVDYVKMNWIKELILIYTPKNIVESAKIPAQKI